jgi:hypothetical protein
MQIKNAFFLIVRSHVGRKFEFQENPIPFSDLYLKGFFGKEIFHDTFTTQQRDKKKLNTSREPENRFLCQQQKTFM